MSSPSPLASRRSIAHPRRHQAGADEALSCVLVFSALGLLLNCLTALAWDGAWLVLP
jgi:hypothetical protein